MHLLLYYFHKSELNEQAQTRVLNSRTAWFVCIPSNEIRGVKPMHAEYEENIV